MISRRLALTLPISLPLARSGTPSFFTVGNTNERRFLKTPAEREYFSIGMNHIDSAPFRATASWSRDFRSDNRRWLRQVREDLVSWGFNTVGWVQEYVVINDRHHRHSRSFVPEEYAWLGLPFCHMPPFLEAHGWEIETRLPKVDSAEFAEWCDYVARDHCARLRDETHLIGYFFSDVPSWVQTTPLNRWRGTLLDPDLNKSPSVQTEMFRLASAYYRTIQEAIRRYDPRHLILGDRYNLQGELPEPIVRAALPYVDVLSFQDFSAPASIEANLRLWAERTAKPVLLADSANWAEPFAAGWPPREDRQHDVPAYRDLLRRLVRIPSCVGIHLCGAYVKNNARRYGFRTGDNGLEPHVAGIAAANRHAVKEFRSLQPSRGASR
jgi:hypothetical protein